MISSLIVKLGLLEVRVLKNQIFVLIFFDLLELFYKSLNIAIDLVARIVYRAQHFLRRFNGISQAVGFFFNVAISAINSE